MRLYPPGTPAYKIPLLRSVETVKCAGTIWVCVRVHDDLSLFLHQEKRDATADDEHADDDADDHAHVGAAVEVKPAYETRCYAVCWGQCRECGIGTGRAMRPVMGFQSNTREWEFSPWLCNAALSIDKSAL